MTGLRHAIIVLGIGVFALALAGAARAQDLSAGKTPAQLFHLNCALCHASPRGLAAAGTGRGGLSGLDGFLAEHYTADPRSAAIIAAYLKSVGGAAPKAQTRRHRNAARPGKPAGRTERAKKTDSEKTDKKSGNAETAAKPEDGKAKAEVPQTAKPKAEKAAKPATAEPKPAAAEAKSTDKVKSTDMKKPATPSAQAKDEKSAAGEKKTD